MTQADLDDLERTILERLAETGQCTPAEVALELDADLARVYSAITTLRDRELIERVGFDTCELTDDGRVTVASEH
ncbi:MAG: hypothetical protein ABEI98_06545 [Halorhabdus sp.]